MASQTCMLCGKSTPIPGEFTITKARESYEDPDLTELKIHIKRNHSLEEMQKYIDPTEFKRLAVQRKAINEGVAMEQESDPTPYTDDVVSALFEKAKGKGKRSGVSRGLSPRRGGKGKRRAKGKNKEPSVVVPSAGTVVKSGAEIEANE